MSNNRQVGTNYEEAVANVLMHHGYRILERNFRCRTGEIDLIAIDGSWLVFMEVKYRKTLRKGMPEEAVTPAKQKTICRVADYYMLCHPEYGNLQPRFDVAAITGNHLKVYPNAFEYQWRRER